MAEETQGGKQIQKQVRLGKTAKPPRKRSKGFLNFLLLIGIIAAIGLFAWAEQQRRAAKSELEKTAEELQQLRSSTQQSGQEVAQRVLDAVGKHIELPTDPAPTVATIVDAEALRQSNSFYDKASNGDHLIITTEPPRAILYSSTRDVILDVVPVSINQAEEQQEAVGNTEAQPPVETQEEIDLNATPDPNATPTPAELAPGEPSPEPSNPPAQ